jgi:hypothetical protein
MDLETRLLTPTHVGIQACKRLHQIAADSVDLRYAECLRACGMMDGHGTHSGLPVTLSERVKILREGTSAWRRLSWTTDFIVCRPKKYDSTRFRTSRDVVLAYSTSDDAVETLIEVYRIPSAMRRAGFERIEWSVPFRVSSAVVDTTRNLVLLFQELESEHGEIPDPIQLDEDEDVRLRCVFCMFMYCTTLEPVV